MLLSLLVTTGYGGSADELTYAFMTSGAMATIFVGLGIVVGTLAPIALLLTPLGRKPAGLMIAALLVLVGGITLRYAILMGPQIVQTFYS
jgi:formate-dependent nitrite reductase membrane component NrfD